MNNALEDIVDAYLRRIEKCKLVERNVFITGGELDAIGIDPDNNRIIMCEATASSNAYGAECVTRLRAKFARAEAYVSENLSWLGFLKIEGQFWAPYISKEQRTGITQCAALKNVRVIDAYEYFQRIAKLRAALRGADPKSLNPTCQLIALEQELKIKMKNRLAHAKSSGGSTQAPIPTSSANRGRT